MSALSALADTDAVIVSAARTPIGRAFKGSLTAMRADDLAALAVTAALARVPQIAAAEVEDLLLGCGQPAGEQGYNIARVVALLAGLRTVPGVTVNRYCSSSLQTIRMAAHAIRAGEGDCFVAAGVEAVSRYERGKADGMPATKNPRFDAAHARTERRAQGGAGDWQPAVGLPDAYVAMGETAENVAEHAGVTRAAMDAWAARSQQRAVEAQAAGLFAREIVPVTTPDGTGVSADDCPRAGTTAEKLAGLRPAFRPDGRVTAGNACPLNDGAAAVVVTSGAFARRHELTPLALIVASGVSALDPEIMGLGPVAASERALARAGMTIADVDRVEINEAFAAQVLPSAERLGIDHDRLNVRGGAIALGHPFGMTGARIMTTLLHMLEDDDLEIGLETMCVGGGQGMAMVVQRLS
ncbi:acetyl-CoA C-acetyltransferase [Conexibacter sp. JD483]|uniref:acetyl-CoA C-acetyltransferase n=1 Tax=unclassified Conexibacter TaxID=2627773 RepID=UPI002715BADD|nr:MULTISPECIES: acetyl-CoA C-acetyltransferase [unclassified Conexibacter]MDO8186811.1 acetyl-CoA C-acetyltransferase [Conexibacter sp. CPCC 205706]MDO8197435.1 acetyl-CoA C-acetyltransferase [Conexibacter sp. CPCC 205762]MDR9370450.1 acetyl-CoA C-acetyltransferase [Conexibacter sp. JD483]